MYRDGKGTEVDFQKSCELFNDAAKQGNVGAIANIISLYVSGTLDDRALYDEQMCRMKRIAESGNADAIRRMGNFYFDGVGVKKDFTTALKWYEKAARMGDSWCRNRLAEMYRDGKGTSIDIGKSMQWYCY